MGMLHLVPYVLLAAVAVWLIWPMIFDPIQRRLSARFHPDAPSPDGVADALFVTWGDDNRSGSRSRRIA